MKKAAFGLALLILSGFLLIILSLIIDDNRINLVGFCILLGFLIKGTDEFIDNPKLKRYRILIFPFAFAIPLIMIYLAYIHDPVFGMVLGTALGLLLTGKIDHPGFILSFLMFIVLVLLLVLYGGLSIAMSSVYIIPLAFAGSYLDEFGHERTSGKEASKAIKWFFEHRFALKTAAVIGTVIGLAQPVHLIAFLCFDIAYDITASALQ